MHISSLILHFWGHRVIYTYAQTYMHWHIRCHWVACADIGNLRKVFHTNLTSFELLPVTMNKESRHTADYLQNRSMLLATWCFLTSLQAFTVGFRNVSTANTFSKWASIESLRMFPNHVNYKSVAKQIFFPPKDYYVWLLTDGKANTLPRIIKTLWMLASCAAFNIWTWSSLIRKRIFLNPLTDVEFLLNNFSMKSMNQTFFRDS